MITVPGEWWVGFTLALWGGLAFTLTALWLKRNW
jgi:hypothetical protein